MEKVIIVGAGPAGISAALYAARGNMNPLVINNGIGALDKAESIENYYGLAHPMTGRELHETGIAQARALGVRVLDAQVLGVEGFDTFVVKTTEGEYETQSLILATGSKRKSPAIAGLKELEGRGVSYCAVCDAFFYRGKKVAVLGNGDFALHEAKELANTAASVTIYTNGAKPEFTSDFPVEINTRRVLAIEGEDKVSGIRLESLDQGTFLAETDGVFVALGTAGSAEIARQMGAELDEKGNIKVNEDMETTIPGMYAAGDCTGGLLQIAKAVHEGCVAGISAGKYVRSINREL